MQSAPDSGEPRPLMSLHRAGDAEEELDSVDETDGLTGCDLAGIPADACEPLRAFLIPDRILEWRIIIRPGPFAHGREDLLFRALDRCWQLDEVGGVRPLRLRWRRGRRRRLFVFDLLGVTLRAKGGIVVTARPAAAEDQAAPRTNARRDLRKAACAQVVVLPRRPARPARIRFPGHASSISAQAWDASVA